ncbi:MAG: hypothetical protein AMXMBFR4_24450 [Candidatus Hydrogenedentota bacterium]
METSTTTTSIVSITESGVVAIAIAVGTLYCFLGYRTLKVILCLTGFALAGAVAAALGAYVTGGNGLVFLAAGIAGGVCGAVALLFLYRLGLFLLGVLATGLAAHMLVSGRLEPWTMAAVGGIAVAGGLATIVLEKLIVSVATAAIGAWLTVCGIGYFLVGPNILDVFQEPLEFGKDRGVLVACWAVLAGAGTLAQFATLPRAPKEVVIRQ